MNETVIFEATSFQISHKSDLKALHEVFTKKAYQRPRLGFKIDPGESWLDLGANIGAFSVWAHLKGAKVIAYEPSPRNIALAKYNCEFNSVRLIQKAIGMQKGETDFYDDPTNPWRSSLMPRKKADRIKVEIQPIAEILAEFRPDGIKMDIEGAELEIIDNLESWGTVKKLVFEYHFDRDKELKNALQRVERLKKYFKNSSYPKYVHCEGLMKWFPPAALMFFWN